MVHEGESLVNVFFRSFKAGPHSTPWTWEQRHVLYYRERAKKKSRLTTQRDRRHALQLERAE